MIERSRRHNGALLMRLAGCSLALLFLSCSDNATRQPVAVNGVMDLRKWDFERDGTVSLPGEWEFAWGQLLTSAQFDTARGKGLTMVPDNWINKKWGAETLPTTGFASYRLRVLLPPGVRTIGFHVLSELTAYAMYLQDTLACGNGTVGRTKEETTPQYHTWYVHRNVYSDTLTLVFHVANFHYWKGGIVDATEMGTAAMIDTVHRQTMMYNGFVYGILVITPIIFICFYLFRRSQKASLFASLLILAGGIRNFATGERLITELLPGISWDLVVRLELGTMHAFSMLAIIAFHSLLPHDFSRKIVRTVSFISLLFIGVMLVTPARIHSLLVLPSQALMFFVLVNMLFTLVRAIVRKHSNAMLMLIATCLVSVPTFSEVLKANNLVHSVIPSFFGYMAFLVMQVVILARLFAQAFRRVENFAGELEVTVRERTRELADEKEKADQLLLNVLPEPIANRLKDGESAIADQFEEASVVFVDIVDFTSVSARIPPARVVQMLNDIFTRFDHIAARYGLEKIKTIGDCYMAASGVPLRRDDHAMLAARFALDAQSALRSYTIPYDGSADRPEGRHVMQCRIGLDCGPIIAGVIGEQKFIYDLWGDMVNTASRMESHGVPDKIQMTERFKHALELQSAAGDGREFTFHRRGPVPIKGKGEMVTYFLSMDN